MKSKTTVFPKEHPSHQKVEKPKEEPKVKSKK